MLAYRHAFHAGNHADVLKHLVLMLVLRHLGTKDKGYRFVDTHAGAGGYSLLGRYAKKNGEYERGIGLLWTRDDLPAPLADYVALVRAFNPDGVLAQYPARPRSPRCCCARRTSCARSSSTRPSRRSCARRSPAIAARRSTTATASSACARRCRRRRAAPRC
jgi:23S rRNA A2030 N6-methylase RlmJ